MALTTKTTGRKGFTARLDRHEDESAANTALTVSVPSGDLRRLLLVTVVYSASVTATPTTTLNSGAGASRDVLLSSIALAPGTEAVFVPDEEILIGDDDSLDVLAPAGGVGVTAAVTVYTRVL